MYLPSLYISAAAFSILFTCMHVLRRPRSRVSPVAALDYATCSKRSSSPCLDADVGKVSMILEETVHYDVGGDLPTVEWLSAGVPWTDLGFVRLGEDSRLYGVSMIHQLHCVDMIQRAVYDPDTPQVKSGHLKHCLDYLRLLFFCNADTTLEPYDFASRNYSAHPVGMTRVCRDWTAVYKAADENFKGWTRRTQSASHAANGYSSN